MLSVMLEMGSPPLNKPILLAWRTPGQLCLQRYMLLKSKRKMTNCSAKSYAEPSESLTPPRPPIEKGQDEAVDGSKLGKFMVIKS